MGNANFDFLGGALCFVIEATLLALSVHSNGTQ
jgi:hypothetical protein